MARIVPYEKQTLSHPNPIARFSHKTRFKISKQIVVNWIKKDSVILDYGCGPGRFLNELSIEKKVMENNCKLMGYDPYVDIKSHSFTIINTTDLIENNSLDIISCLETVEHLENHEVDFFLDFAKTKLKKDGKILITIPIMIGPALFVKEIARIFLFRKLPDINPWDMFKAGIFGINAPRTKNVKGSHRGFNWKLAKKKISEKFSLTRLTFSPIPFIGWYGNSQAIMEFTKKI